MPIVPDRECQQASIGIENDTFPFTQNGACLKIIRTFRVIDWCIADGPGSIFEPFEFVQTIKVNNTEGPEIEVFADTVFCSFEVDCGAININDYLVASATDDCTADNELLNRYEVTDADDNLVDFGTGLDASGTYDVGTYTVRFISEDKCGNQEFEESTFEVRSCKLPTPYCLQGLSTTLTAMDTTGDGTADAEMVMLAASFFDAGSYHPCGYDVTVSFSSDVNDTLRTFFCSDTTDLQEIELWVTDDNGGQDFCITLLDVQDNDTIDLCGGLRPVDIAGRVYTETDAELSDVAVELISYEILTSMTDADGLYEFADMPQGGNYKVKPIKDNDYMNGVSTLDLVMIQRHILGLAPLESVYKRIAADINNDEKISSSDLLALRKMILGINTSFPNNTSWRFVDSGYEFVDEENPWAGEIAEDYEIAGLTDDMQINFMAVKTGDVNGNVTIDGFSGGEIETRNASTMILELPDLEVEKGNMYEIEVRGLNASTMYGMQFTMDMNNVEVVEIKNGSLDVSNENIAQRSGQWHRSYAKANGVSVNSGSLFTVVIKANEDGLLSEMIELSNRGLSSEYYTGQDLETGELIIEWRDSDENTNPISTLGLEGNNPNPWRNSTEIVFQLPRSGKAQLIVTDINGRLLVNQTKTFTAGNNYFRLTDDDVQISGMLLYEIRFEDQAQNGKMIKIE